MATASSKEAPTGGKGIIDTPSTHSVDLTVERLKDILQSKGVLSVDGSTFPVDLRMESNQKGKRTVQTHRWL